MNPAFYQLIHLDRGLCEASCAGVRLNRATGVTEALRSLTSSFDPTNAAITPYRLSGYHSVIYLLPIETAIGITISVPIRLSTLSDDDDRPLFSRIMG